MEARPATVAVRTSKDSDLIRALIAHLSTATLSLVNTDPHFEPHVADLNVWVDGQELSFSVMHAITRSTRVADVVLMHSDHDEGDDTQENHYDFVLVHIDDADSTVQQKVIGLNEPITPNNRHLILQELVEYMVS